MAVIQNAGADQTGPTVARKLRDELNDTGGIGLSLLDIKYRLASLDADGAMVGPRGARVDLHFCNLIGRRNACGIWDRLHLYNLADMDAKDCFINPHIHSFIHSSVP